MEKLSKKYESELKERKPLLNARGMYYMNINLNLLTDTLKCYVFSILMNDEKFRLLVCLEAKYGAKYSGYFFKSDEQNRAI